MLCNLSIAIFDENFESSRMLEDVLFSLDVKNTSLVRTCEGFKASLEIQQFDVIFLQHSIDNYDNHYDVINRFIVAGLIPCSTRLIFLSSSHIPFDYTCEYPFHTCRVIDNTYTSQMIKQELEQHTLQISEFSTAYRLIDQEKYKDALLHLKNLRNKSYPNFLKRARNQILVNLLIKIGQYNLARNLLVPLAEKHIEWASWCLFNVNYELKQFDECHVFLKQPHIQTFYPNRVFYWEVYIAFQMNKTAHLVEKAQALDLETLTPNTLLLSLYVLVINNKLEAARELIECKRAKSNSEFISFINYVEAKLLVLDMLKHNCTSYLDEVKKLFNSASKHITISKSIEFNAFIIVLMHINGNTDSAKSKLAMLDTEAISDPIELLTVSYIKTKFAQDKDSFKLLVKAHSLISKQSKNCHYVFSGIMHKRSFEFMFEGKELRTRAYETMGRQLFNQRDYRSALKLYTHALVQNLSSPEIEDKVSKCAKLSGIDEQYYIGIMEDFAV